MGSAGAREANLISFLGVFECGKLQTARLTLNPTFPTTAGPGSGAATLFINDKPVGEGKIARLVPITFGLSEGLTVGRDPSTPVTESYQSPFGFTGKIKKVVMELKEDPKQVSLK
jgi:hypothetical protein